MIRIILIIFLLTTSVKADCQYSATADVINNVLVNKKEVYKCTEDANIFVQFLTEEKWSRTFTTVFFVLLENL